MNTYTHHHRLDTLVGHPEYITAYHPSQVGKLLSNMLKGLMNWLTAGSVPRISREVHGDLEIWRVYDPSSNQTFHFDSEDDVRVWMEERYYQQ